MRAFSCIVFFCLFLTPVATNAQARKKTNRFEANRPALAAAMEKSLRTELLAPWYPRCVDTLYGGFITGWNNDFSPAANQDKMIVTQARHVWVNAKAAMLYPDVRHYKTSAIQGFRFLEKTMWDQEYGGFYNLVTKEGRVKTTEKEAYGNAFGIYALAAFFKMSGDTSALALAKKAFYWLEANSHDKQYKGYFQHLLRNGTPYQRPATEASLSDKGYKDQNSSIHLLEAFTELYEVWPDPLLRERLTEMLSLIRDVITTERGNLILFFTPDWQPISFADQDSGTILKHHYLDHVSFGHDVETAYLLLEASHALNWKNDSTTLRIAKKMVDHALDNGWDNRVGGFYDEGYYFKNSNAITITKDSKNWWAQAEGLNSLLLMHTLFPNDRRMYAKQFLQLWHYVNNYLIDHTHGGWYEGGLDKQPNLRTTQKGHIWKATYHTFRSLANCVASLKKQEAAVSAASR